MKRTNHLIVLLAMVVMLAGGAVKAQTNQEPANTAPAQPPQQPAENAMSDLRQLGLMPEQIQKIRAINFELKDQRQAAGMKLRQAQRALAEAIESPTTNEALIEQRSREVAEAQANTIRLRSLTEARVLQVLTPEQRLKLREIRQRNLAEGRRRKLPDAGRNQQGLQGNTNNGNSNVLTPAQRRALRRQQQRP